MGKGGAMGGMGAVGLRHTVDDALVGKRATLYSYYHQERRAMLDDDEFLQKAAEAMAVIAGIDSSVYAYSPIPSADDKAIGRIVALYLEATPVQRELLTKAHTKKRDAAHHVQSVLGVYGIRMSMYAVRRNSGSILRYGIVGTVMGMEWAHSDPRDNGANVVPLLAHSAYKLGIDIERAFGEGAALGTDSWTRTCIMPPLKDRHGVLPGYGWAEYDGPAGVVYWREPSSEPIPEGLLTAVDGEL